MIDPQPSQLAHESAGVTPAKPKKQKRLLIFASRRHQKQRLVAEAQPAFGYYKQGAAVFVPSEAGTLYGITIVQHEDPNKSPK